MGNKDKEIIFRPVTLTVLDAETKQPLEGIVINILNITFYPKRYKFFGMIIEQFDIKTLYEYSYLTDANGVVEVPQYLYIVKPNNYLYSQDIIINLEVKDKSADTNDRADILYWSFRYKEGEKYFLYRPHSYFKAGQISCKPFIIPEVLKGQTYNPYLTRVFNEHEIPDLSDLSKEERDLIPSSFFCDFEEFTFYLERFVEIDEPQTQSGGAGI